MLGQISLIATATRIIFELVSLRSDIHGKVCCDSNRQVFVPFSGAVARSCSYS